MASRDSPTVWRRWLSAELKAARERLDLNQKAVAAECGWSGARLSYLEKGQQVPTEADLDALLPHYDLDPEAIPTFYEAVKFAREKGWWERYAERTVPTWLADFIGLEQGASLIRSVEPFIVPGLLQTRDYVMASSSTDVVPRTATHLLEIADVRRRRQEVLDTEPVVALDAVIDESVFRRVVGGPAVMAAQVGHIVEMAERPNVTVRVFPFERGVNQGMTGAYRILDFHVGLPPLVYVEGRESANFIDEPSAVALYVLSFGHLADACWSPERSLDFLRAVQADYGAG